MIGQHLQTISPIEISGDNVGIDITPSAKLHVRDTSTLLEIRAQSDGTDGTTQIRMQNDARVWVVKVDGSKSDRYIIRDHTGGREPFVIGTNGNTGFMVADPLAIVHASQSSATGAEPVLRLEQSDVSEEFIRFVGSAAAATLTQSIVAEADVTTATRAGFLKVYVQDDGNQITDQAYYLPIYTLA